jgi:hypothetical protein
MSDYDSDKDNIGSYRNYEHNRTEDLIGDTFTCNQYTQSQVNRKFNNTANLLDDRTSLLTEDKISRLLNSKNSCGSDNDKPGRGSRFRSDNRMLSDDEDVKVDHLNITEDDSKFNINCLDYLRTSVILEESISKYRKPVSNNNVTTNQTFNLSVTASNVNNYKYSNNSKKIEVLYISNYVNFDICLPGQVVKRVLGIKNVTNESIDLEVRFSDDDNLKELFEATVSESMGDMYMDIINSQKSLKCFTFNHNGNVLTINLANGEIFDLEVVLNTPFSKSKTNLFTNVEIFSKNKFLQNIPVMGHIEIPKLLCLKEFKTNAGSLPLISIQVEIKSKGQKYKIPFKNLSLVDLEIDLMLEKKFNDNIVKIDRELYQCQFICFPGNLIVPAQGTVTLDLVAKVTKIEANENINEEKLTNMIRKVLIAKVRGANVFYTFFVEAFFK